MTGTHRAPGSRASRASRASRRQSVPARRTALRRVLGATGFTLALLLAAAMAAGALLGVRALPVLTGSMTPYAPVGSLVLTVPVAGDQVERGDVIAFRPPAPFVVADSRPVLHRVDSLGTQDGQAYLTTKGDANPAADPWRVATDGARFTRAVLVVPHVGHLVAGGTRAAVLLALGTTVLLLALSGLRRPPPCSHATTTATA